MGAAQPTESLRPSTRGAAAAALLPSAAAAPPAAAAAFPAPPRGTTQAVFGFAGAASKPFVGFATSGAKAVPALDKVHGRDALTFIVIADGAIKGSVIEVTRSGMGDEVGHRDRSRSLIQLDHNRSVGGVDHGVGERSHQGGGGEKGQHDREILRVNMTLSGAVA